MKTGKMKKLFKKSSAIICAILLCFNFSYFPSYQPKAVVSPVSVFQWIYSLGMGQVGNGEMYEAYLRIIKLLYDCGQDEEAEYYEIAMRGRFPKKISKLNNIIEEIEYGNFNISELLIEVFEKDDFNIISSNDFLEIGRSYFGVKNYKLAAKNLIKSVEKNPENLEAIELLKAIHTILLS